MASRFGSLVANFKTYRPASFIDTGSDVDSSRTWTLGSSSVPEGLSSLHRDLDNLVSEDELDGHKTIPRIKRSHWKDQSKVNYCTKCSKAFGFATKKSNCKRCGDVFCEKCCQYRKRLNEECEPDPQGIIYRVCYKCSELHTQALGECRSLTEEFFGQRRNKRMIISREISRLKKGFEQNIDPNSSIKNVFSETLFAMKVPEWQKSSKWLESQEVELCTNCSSKFTIFNTKNHCRVCGSVYCHRCCKNDLLLYYDDEDGTSCAKLIGVVGCPDKEPRVAHYLPVCTLCHDDLEEYQVQQYHFIIDDCDKEKRNLSQVGAILERLRSIEKKIDTYLPRFQDMCESKIYEQEYEYESISQDTSFEDFAKLQGDLSDLFTKYAVVIQGLKQYELSSKTGLEIMRNIVTIKCDACKEGMKLFKSLKADLNTALPTEEFEKLQSYANMLAINNTFVMTRQLGLEALSLSMKYEFDLTIAGKIGELDNFCYEELKAYVEATGEDWDSHLKVLMELLRHQLETKKLIVPCATLALRDGSNYVYHFLLQRAFALLRQVLRALKAKSSDAKFTESKEKLQELLNDISDKQMKQKE